MKTADCDIDENCWLWEFWRFRPFLLSNYVLCLFILFNQETDQLKLRQEMTLDNQQMKHRLDLMKKSEETFIAKLEKLEKENHILLVTLQQRDEEITKLHEITE